MFFVSALLHISNFILVCIFNTQFEQKSQTLTHNNCQNKNTILLKQNNSSIQIPIAVQRNHCMNADCNLRLPKHTTNIMSEKCFK